MAVYYWVGGWTGNTGINSGFAATGSVSVVVGPTGDLYTYGPLWTSPFNGAQATGGDFAFGPYYWGFIQNWRLRSNIPNSNQYKLTPASNLPRGGDTVLFGSREITSSNLTETAMLFGGLSGGTSWLGSTGLTTALAQGLISFSVSHLWGHPSTDNSLQVTNGPAGFGEYKGKFRVNQIGFDCGEGGTAVFAGNVLGLSADTNGIELLKVLLGNFQVFSPYAKIGILSLKGNPASFSQTPLMFTGPSDDAFNTAFESNRPQFPDAAPPVSTKLSGFFGGVVINGGNFSSYDHAGFNFNCNSLWVGSHGGAIGNVLLNEDYFGISTMSSPGNVTIIPYKVNGVIGIYAGVPGQLSLYRPTIGTMNVELGSKHGYGGVTIANLNTYDEGVSAGTLGDIVVNEFSFIAENANLQSGIFKPSELVQPIGIYPIFREGSISRSAILDFNHPTLDSSDWNNTLVGFSPSDKGLTIVEGGRKVIFSPGTNFKTTDGLTQT